MRNSTEWGKKPSNCSPPQFGKACCQFACASVDSTFAFLTSFGCSTRGPSTTYVGVKTSDIAVRGSSFLRSEREKRETVLDDVVWSYVNRSCTWSRILQHFFSMVSLRGCDNLHRLRKIFGNSWNAPVLSPINANKRGDVIGILVTLLPVVPRIFLRDLLHLNNVVLITCYIPGRKIKNWKKKKKTIFRPKAFTDLGSNQHWIPGFMLAAHWRCILCLQTW